MKLRNRYHEDYGKIMQNLPDDRRGEALNLTRALARGRQDPIYFGEYFLGLQYTSKQKIWLWLTTKTQILASYQLAKVINYVLPDIELALNHKWSKNILAPGNRFGKTFVTATKHLWYNFYKIGLNGDPKTISAARYQTLNLSPHSMQVDALYNYVVDILQSKFVYEWEGQKIKNECKIGTFLIDHRSIKREIEFANNSMLKGAPTGDDQASSIAGTNFFYISYDEAPQSIHLREELPAKILSRLLDSGGPLDLIGTPEIDKPSHQYYSRVVKLGLSFKEGWFTFLGGIDDNTFISQENKEKTLDAIKSTDPKKYKQVRFGEFISGAGKLFPNNVIERLWEGTPQEPLTGHKYLQACDWGFSDDGDPTIFYMFDLTELFLSNEDFIRFYGPDKIAHARIVHRLKLEGPDPYEAVTAARLLQQNYNEAIFVHDSSSMGGVMLKKMLRTSGIRHLVDFTASGESKDEMLFATSRSLSYRITDANINQKIIPKHNDFGKIRSFLIPELEEQLGTYKRDDKKLEQDEVMAFSMGVWYIEKKLQPQHIPVYSFNILAPKAEQVLRPLGANNRELKMKTFTITERHI